jgi:hypothetical protein
VRAREEKAGRGFATAFPQPKRGKGGSRGELRGSPVTAAAGPLAAAPRRSKAPSPVRRPGSVRRTSTIDVTWPGDRWGNMKLTARARDVFTPESGGSPIILAEDRFEAVLQQDRLIVAIEGAGRPKLARLVGQRGGGHLREVLEQVMPEERQGGTPLYLILDDISGASLVSGWAWSQWSDDWLSDMSNQFSDEEIAQLIAARAGVCVGFAPGSTALTMGPKRETSSGTPTVDLRNPHDPQGWHEYPAQTGVAMRRARRIDVMLAGEVLVDAAFQDSANRPSGERAALHEYGLTVTADPATSRIRSIEADPRVLPFPECPSATNNLTQLLGEPLSDLRSLVLARFPRTAGCTHLNDALRSLAEVPILLQHLRQHAGREPAV